MWQALESDFDFWISAQLNRAVFEAQTATWVLRMMKAILNGEHASQHA
jgi:hypothetical protein